jgi:hypothetical protein
MARITNKAKTSIEVVIPVTGKQELIAEAERLTTDDKEVFTADVVRVALQEYFERRQREVSFEVDRGGNRRPNSAA